MKKRSILKKGIVLTVVFSFLFSLLATSAYAEVNYSSVDSMGTVRGMYPAVATLQDGRILVIGGMPTSSSATSTVEIYNPDTKSWSYAASLLTDLRYLTTRAVTLNDGRVLVAGGDIYGDGVWAVNTVQIYDPIEDSWSYGETLHYSREYPSAALLDDGRVLVTGGEDPDRNVLTSAEIYDPDIGHWTEVASMNQARGSHASTTLNDGRVLVVGGDDDYLSDGRLNSVEIYDPDKNTWTEAASLPSDTYPNGLVAMVLITLDDGRAMLLGGNSGSTGSVNAELNTYYYYPESDTWEQGPDMPSDFNKSRAGYTVMDDGKLFFAGGGDESSNYSKTVAIVDIIEPTLKDTFGLTVSPGTLSPEFDPDTKFYSTETFGNDQTAIAVTPTSDDETDTIEINGAPVESGVATPVSLQAGLNHIYIDVTDEERITRRYTLDVTREGDAPSTKEVVEDTATDLLGVTGLTISSVDAIDSAYGTVSIAESDVDSDFDDILYTPATGYNGTFTVNYTTDTGAKTVVVTVTPTYNVVFHDYDNSEIETRVIKDGLAVHSDGGAVSDPTRAHYDFDGWGDGSNTYTSSQVAASVPTDDITYTATYSPTDYDITYHLNGGANGTGNPSDYNIESETITLANASKNGYTFGGWYTDSAFSSANKVTQIVSGSYGNMELWAKLTPIEYSITYHLNSGTNDAGNPSDYNVESAAITLADATRTSYTFGGWYTDSAFTESNKATQIASGSMGNVELWAKWTPDNYDITYNLNGGTNGTGNPSCYNVESETVTLADAARSGYTFSGWYTDSDCTTGCELTQIESGSTGDVEVWAKWTIVDYDITYYLNGGTNDSGNPSEYNVESDTITLADATTNRASYVFGGWYTDSAFTTGNKVTRIASGSTGNMNLWAKWTPVAVTGVALDKHEGSYVPGDTDTLSAVAGPDDAFNTGLTWTSSNENVATVTPGPDGTATITILDVGTAVITVTTEDGGYTDTYTIGVSSSEDASGGDGEEQLGNVIGRLLDDSGASVSGYKFTLYSDPVTEMTDSAGEFAFENVAFTNHTLIIESADGVEIGRYKLDFDAGSKTGYAIDDNNIHITYTDTTVTVELLFNTNKDKTGVSLNDVEITENPQTGGTGGNWLPHIVMGVIVAGLALLALALIMILVFKVRNQKKYV